jgi:hypothetical protein
MKADEMNCLWQTIEEQETKPWGLSCKEHNPLISVRIAV